ncbi:MAG: anaerobic selenocysteine-containing dehydrogenase/Fe-S-cluster-containing dehydrogenase component [Myxococcota bacterium]|jgi:anaerobic selenocysteine-containing dehydrogenase/Fe-S-cluster-containing dehydrogenase component
MPELDRRDFLKLVGATTGAVAAAGCSDPVEKLIPYVVQPEETLPGTSTTYASTCMECPSACGLHVTVRDGRPIKLEGHPDHPINSGTLCARGQVGLGRVYHPDRHESALVKGANGQAAISWADATATVAGKVKASPAGTWIFGSPVGPTLSGVMDEFIAATGAAGRVIYEPFSNASLRAAAQMVFGRSVVPEFDLSGADLVLDFSSDFLDQGLSPVEHAMQFSKAKDVAKHGGAALINVGSRLSMSASKADKWIPSTPGGEGALALALAIAIFPSKGGALEGDLRGINDLVGGQNIGQLLKQAGVDQKTFDGLVARVLKAEHAVALPPGVSVASSGGTSDAAAVLLLNVLLGGLGGGLKVPAEDSAEHGAPYSEVQALIAAMKAGEVDVLIINGANPVYSLPAASGFVDALAKVGTVVSLATLTDETSQAAGIVMPAHDAFESWGDASPRTGIRTLVQPTMRPLFDTRATGDTLLAIAREAGAQVGDGSFLDRLKGAWADTDWRQTLANGGVYAPAEAPATSVAPTVSQINVTAPALSGSGEFTLVAYPHTFIGDGSGATLPWLQEIPDPVARASWLSWLEISKNTCDQLGVDYGEVVEVSTEGGSVKLPVYPRGGIQDNVIAIAIGQGHTVGHYASLAGDGRPGVARGVSVVSLLADAASDNGGQAWLSTKASVTVAGQYQRIPLTQFTDNQRGRKLAPTISLAALAAGTESLDGHGAGHAVPAAAAAAAHGGGHAEEAAEAGHGAAAGGHGEPHEILLPYDPANDAHPDNPYRWAMSIDNDKCTGCGACVAACYTENSIPIVGEEGMARHREMSWIRIERYVDEGDRSGGTKRRPYPDREALGKTDVRYAPMLCQHCGAAPCESVCPVIATYHSEDGMNAMIYNRCVGTRYCGNNCSYKVRRFNYFDYSRHNWPGNMNQMLNPDVTARQQGVMEKCTFCVQRVASARQTAKNEGRPIADGEVRTACQQTCPSQAIQFGNAKDKSSKVVTTSNDEKRAYHSLHVLNTRPAITYLKQVDRADDERSHG